jgi:hypothetical protein
MCVQNMQVEDPCGLVKSFVILLPSIYEMEIHAAS